MNDYAVIKTGGKQYLVEQGTKIDIEKLEGKPGEKITFEDVLMTSISGKVLIGKPVVKNSKVIGEIEQQFKGPKVQGIRYKNKTRHSVRFGHRQNLTSIIIKELTELVEKKPVEKKPVEKKPVAKKPVAKKPVAKKPVAKKPVAKKPVAKKPKGDKDGS